MKAIIISVILILLTVNSSGQIPNYSFENWINGSPESWFTSNTGGVINPVTRTTAAHSGTYALKGEVVSLMNNPVFPLLISGENREGFPVMGHPDSLILFYQFYPSEGDKFFIGVELSRSGTPIAAGSTEISGTVSVYTKATVQIDYLSAEEPDHCNIIIAAGSTASSHPGTFFLLDDLQFVSGPLDVNENLNVSLFRISQNYPNPFNAVTVIGYSVPERTNVSLKIFDLLGNEIITLVDEEKLSGSYEVKWDAGKYPSGYYFYRIVAGDYFETRKMILLK